MTTKKADTRTEETLPDSPGRATAPTTRRARGTYHVEGVEGYWQSLARLAMTPPDLATHRACIFLSRHGKRFLVDFGFANARELARSLRRERAIAPGVADKVVVR